MKRLLIVVLLLLIVGTSARVALLDNVQIVEGNRHKISIPAGSHIGNKTITVFNPNFYPVTVTVPAASGCACLRVSPAPLSVPARSRQTLHLQLEPENPGQTLVVSLVGSGASQKRQTPLYLQTAP